MNAVWAVTSGSYSDYTVNCVCADETTARTVVEYLNQTPRSDPYEVEEMTMINSADEVRRYFAYYFEIAYRDGVARSRSWSHELIAWGQDDGPTPITEFDRLSAEHVIIGAARDPERALKLASDRMAQWRAERETEPTP